MRRKSEGNSSEYYVASKDRDHEELDTIETGPKQPSLKMTLKKKPGEGSDEYYVSVYTLEMNEHLRELEESGNKNEQHETEMGCISSYDRQQLAGLGHYTHVDQLKDKLDYYPVGSFPEDKLRELQLEVPMVGMIIKYLEEQILAEEKRMREKIYKTENTFLIDENSQLLYHIELVAGGLVKDYCLVWLFVPEDMCDYLIQEYHQRAHQGLDRLVAQIRQCYWFPKMVSNYINNCNICQLQKQLRNPFKAPLKTRKVITNTAEVWYLDHFGLINTKRLGFLHSYAEKESEDQSDEEIKPCPASSSWQLYIIYQTYTM